MSEQINSVRRHNTQAARRTTRKLQNWMSNSIQRDRLKQLCFTTYVVINMKSPHFFSFSHFGIYFFHFSFSFFFFPFFFFSFFFHIFQSSEHTPKTAKKRRTVPIAKRTIFFCKNSICGPRWTSGFRKSPFEGARFRVSHCFFQKCLLLVLVSEFNCRCFLRSRCSLEMWCPDDMERDCWDWVGPPAWVRACCNSSEWGGGSSPVKTEPHQIVLLLL